MSTALTADLASLRIHRDPNAPSATKKWLTVLGVLVGLVLLGGISWLWGWPYLEARLFKTEVQLTEISTVSPVQSLTELTATGYVVPEVVSKIGSKTSGTVQRVLVKQGDLVKAGDLLFALDDGEHKSALAISQARVRATQARLLTEQANLHEQEQKLERIKRLGATETPAAKEDLQARVQALRAATQTVQAEIRTGQAEVQNAQLLLGQRKIYAPIGGVVLGKPPEVGDVIGPQTTLFDVADLTSLLVEADIRENQLNKVKVQAPCEIVLDAFEDKRLRGRVWQTVPKLNRAKASAIVKVRFEDSLQGVLPEMAAKVRFLNEEIKPQHLQEKPKLVVPKEALVPWQGGQAVFVVEEGVVRKVPVTLGNPLREGVELLQGPPAETKVVKNPPSTLANGQKIKEKSE